MSALVKTSEAESVDAGRELATAETPVAIVCAASALSVTAALTHLWAAPRIYVELWGYETFAWWWYAALYVLVYLGLAVYAAALLRWPTQPMFLLGIGAGAMVVALYLYDLRSLSSGVLGPVQLAGVVAGAGLVLALVMLLDSRYRDKVITSLLVAGVVFWAFKLAGVIS